MPPTSVFQGQAGDPRRLNGGSEKPVFHTGTPFLSDLYLAGGHYHACEITTGLFESQEADGALSKNLAQRRSIPEMFAPLGLVDENRREAPSNIPNILAEVFSYAASSIPASGVVDER